MIRKLHKVAALLLMLLLLGAAAVPATAATLGEDMTFGHISEYKDFYEQYQHAADAVAKGIYDLQTNIDISDDRVPIGDAEKLYTIVSHTHPELFYASPFYSYSYYSSGGTRYIYSLNLHWGKALYDETGNYIIENNKPKEELYTDEQVLAMREEFRARAQWYLDMVDEGMSDFDKALILHDALALNSYYLLQGETYDLMVNGMGKCYGYSECYSYLLAQVGINSEIVESEAMYHQWNKVEIDGVYYHVDVTHDDPLPDKPGFAEHTYFLLSDAAIQADGTNPHYGYESDFPSDDTRYDGKSYHRYNTQLCYAGNTLYAVDNTGKQLVTYDVDTDTAETVQAFPYKYWTVKDHEGYAYSGMFMALQEQDGFLYMNTENKVMAYDTETGEMYDFAQNTFDKKFYGLRIIDGKVYAALAESPNETGALELVGDCLPRIDPLHDYVVAGSHADIFGTQWDALNDDNLMYEDGGVYTKTYRVDKAYAYVQLKVVRDSAEWFGDEDGKSIDFNLTGAGTFTVTFDPQTLTASVSGDIVEKEPPSEIVPGDFNGDGALTINDVTLLQRHLAEFEALTEEQLLLADSNDDGRINVDDVTAMQRILAETA